MDTLEEGVERALLITHSWILNCYCLAITLGLKQLSPDNLRLGLLSTSAVKSPRRAIRGSGAFSVLPNEIKWTDLAHIYLEAAFSNNSHFHILGVHFQVILPSIN